MTTEETTASDNALVAHASQQGQLAALDAGMQTLTEMLGEAAGLVVHNFDGDKNNQFRLESLCLNGELLRKEEVMSTPFDVKYAYLHTITIAGNQPGELIDAVRTVLIDPDYNAVGFVSAGVAMGIYRAFVQYGRVPFDPPLRVRVANKRTRKGFNITTLVPVFDK